MTLEEARALIEQSANAVTPDKLAKTEWRAVNESSLPPELAAIYAAKREADALAKDAREAFEAAFRKLKTPPKGKQFVFGYKWGKLSIGLADDDGKPRSNAKAASFSDL